MKHILVVQEGIRSHKRLFHIATQTPNENSLPVYRLDGVYSYETDALDRIQYLHDLEVQRQAMVLWLPTNSREAAGREFDLTTQPIH
jgi:hypothetical protein